VARFVDTNVLLYAVSADPSEEPKQRAALTLLRKPDLALSTQVLAEFFVQATRPGGGPAIPRADAIAFMETLFVFPVQAVTVDLVRATLGLQERFRLSYWDAQVCAAARALGCTQLLTEDLNTGQDYGGVVAVNPFASL